MRGWLAPLLVIALVPGWSGEERLPLLGQEAQVRAQRLDRLAADSPTDRLGALRYLGGVRLSGPDRGFGGFSALHVAGDRFTLLSDAGNIVRFRMDGDWRVHDAEFDNLRDGPRAGWDKSDRDSESMAVDPATGRAWIGFENSNMIWRYDVRLARSDGYVRPDEMRRWPRNGGAESMARLGDGRFVVLSEYAGRGAPEDSYRALLFDGDPVEPRTRATGFFYRPPLDFNPTDMAELPDGRLAVLNRRVVWPGGFEAALTLIDPAAIRAGAVVGGREVARFPGGLRAGFGRDNFEALAVTTEGDSVILWLATDDNLQWPQRSLLLKFELVGARPR